MAPPRSNSGGPRRPGGSGRDSGTGSGRDGHGSGRSGGGSGRSGGRFGRDAGHGTGRGAGSGPRAPEGGKRHFGDHKSSADGDRASYVSPREGRDRNAPAGERTAYGDRRPSANTERRPSSDGKRSFGDNRREAAKRNAAANDRNGPRNERATFGDRRPSGANDRRPNDDGKRSFGDRRRNADDSISRSAEAGHRDAPWADRSAPGNDRGSFGDRRPTGAGERRPTGAPTRSFGGDRRTATSGQSVATSNSRSAAGNDRNAHAARAYGERNTYDPRGTYGDRNSSSARNAYGEKRAADAKRNADGPRIIGEGKRPGGIEHRPSRPAGPSAPSTNALREDGQSGERIAKVLARAGIASRREVERLITEGRVRQGDEVITTPATLLTSLKGISVDGKPVRAPEAASLWAFHKPSGLITAERDPSGRPTIYIALRNALPLDTPRLMPVGRLDLNTEGLLLLTNDGELKRAMELPSSGVPRTYRARTFGDITQSQLEDLIEGITIDGIHYGKIDANMERRTGRNQWVEVTLTEGKNREVRRVLEHLGLQVSRLMRTKYGPFELLDLPRGQAIEIPQVMVEQFRKTLKTTTTSGEDG